MKKTIINFFQKYWRTLIEIATFIGVVIALLQFNLQQKQFIYEQSQKPSLFVMYKTSLSPADEEAITLVANDLIESFYKNLYEEKNEKKSTYQNAIHSILPMKTTLKAREFFLKIEIENKGTATAKKVRVNIEINRPIALIEIDANEPFEFIKGGEGQLFATIEIDRIVAQDKITINVFSQKVDGDDQLDQIILYEMSKNEEANSVDSEGDQNEPSITSDNWVMHVDDSGFLEELQLQPFFPRIEYVSPEKTSVKILVTDEDGSPQMITSIDELFSSYIIKK